MERILVCGTDSQFRTTVQKVLGGQAGPFEYIDDPASAISEAADHNGIVLIDSASVRGGLDGVLAQLSKATNRNVPVVVRSASDAKVHVAQLGSTSLLVVLAKEHFDSQLPQTVTLSVQLAQLRRQLAGVTSQLEVTDRTLDDLIRLGRSIARHKDLHTLLGAILTEVRQATQADSGSLYMVEEDRDHTGNLKSRHLRFKIPQNDSIPVQLSNHTLSIDPSSVAGYVAQSGETLVIDDVYLLSADSEYRFDRNWDELTGYKSRSMLVIPMKDHNDQVLGVIQLINKKPDAKHKGNGAAEGLGRSFDPRDVELAEAIASHAAIAIENVTIIEDMMRLFDGFVSASATAVECMDSATSGHCERLAQYAVNTALRINQLTDGPLAQYKFSKEGLKELRYAALLHDIGKIGVRESVLKKDRRLTEDRLELIKVRFQYFKEVLRHKAFRQAMNSMFSGGAKSVSLAEVETQLDAQVKELDDMLQYILQINTYGKLDDPDYEKLKKIFHGELVDVEGHHHAYLSADEFENLSVRRGNLTPKEREEIEEHVVLTYNILASIPWLPEYRMVPAVAGAHHERNNGSGYPHRLKGEQIPIGGQILAMLDIYEALTASDRPYKPPVTIEKALAIIEAEAKANNLNSDIVRLFIDQEIYKTVKIPEAKTPRKEGSTKDAW